MEVAVRKALLLRSTLYKDVQADVLSSLSLLTETLKLDAKSLAASFDKFMTVSRMDNTMITVDDVEAFRKEQQAVKMNSANIFAKRTWEELDREDVSAVPHLSQRLSPYLAKLPASIDQNNHTSAVNEPVNCTFKENCSNGAIQSILNENIAVKLREGDTHAPNLEIIGAPVASDARYMLDRLANKVAYIDRRISAFEKELEAVHGEGAAHPIATATQQSTYFVGRICCDTEDSRLNAQSVLLEGSISTSQGARVRVDLSSCNEYRLFPGQIAIFKGTNPSGFCVVASEMLRGIECKEPLPPPPSEMHATYIIAAGPFTTNEDLSFQPLTVLLEYAATVNPDMLLLAGPFLDADHPVVRNGELLETFDSVFLNRVVEKLEEFHRRRGGKTRVGLLPSPRDVHHDPIYPQPPLRLPDEIAALPNPATFDCNGVVIGCSSVDWLMSCTKEEISASSKPADRLPAMAAHVLAQRSYFPLYPAPLGTPLDTSLASAMELTVTPHILVLPSDLAAFAKPLPVENTSNTGAEGGQTTTLCINPGKLVKGASPGTFAQVSIVPATSEGEDAGITSRCRVEIRKL